MTLWPSAAWSVTDLDWRLFSRSYADKDFLRGEEGASKFWLLTSVFRRFQAKPPLLPPGNHCWSSMIVMSCAESSSSTSYSKRAGVEHKPEDLTRYGFVWKCKSSMEVQIVQTLLIQQCLVFHCLQIPEESPPLLLVTQTCICTHRRQGNVESKRT